MVLPPTINFILGKPQTQLFWPATIGFKKNENVFGVGEFLASCASAIPFLSIHVTYIRHRSSKKLPLWPATRVPKKVGIHFSTLLCFRILAIPAKHNSLECKRILSNPNAKRGRRGGGGASDHPKTLVLSCS